MLIVGHSTGGAGGASDGGEVAGTVGTVGMVVGVVGMVGMVGGIGAAVLETTPIPFTLESSVTSTCVLSSDSSSGDELLSKLKL